MKELCRVCATELKGTQRRWLFSSRSEIPLQLILAHVLGQRVARDGRAEFLCGKCAFSLERVYRFDTVIARVKALSIEKIQRLLTEKDKLAQCLCYLHGQHHQPAQGPSYTGQDITVDIANLPHVQYNTLLQDDLVMSEYECWSERSGSEPHSCACQHRNCSGCSAIRVSDSTYESVCRIPRRLARALAKGHLFQLSKNKSRSMPLDWLQVPERRASSSNSAHSLWTGGSSRSHSRSLSVSSLGAAPDSEKESEDQVFEEDSPPPGLSLGHSLASMLLRTRGIAYRPIRSPPNSKIPVRIRSGGRATSSGSATPQRELSFASDEESFLDLRSPFTAEYLPFDLEKFHKRGCEEDGTQPTVRQLREQLEAARRRIQILEAQEAVTHQQVLSLPAPTESSRGERSHESFYNNRMIQQLGTQLHSKEQLLQEFMELLQQLTRGSGPVGDVEVDLIGKLHARLKDRDTALQRAADDRFAALEEQEAKVQQLRSALREKDRDLGRLGRVLCRNEEMINMLGHTLKVKHAAVEQLETLCESLKRACRQLDEGRASALKEKSSIIVQLQETLQHRAKDVEALTDSVLSQGLGDGSDRSALLCLRLKAKEELLSRTLSERDRQSADHAKVIEELLKNVEEKDQMIKALLASHLETISLQGQEVQALKQQLSARDKELEELAKSDTTETQDRFIELAALRTLLDDKDQLIVNLLEDGKQRDCVLTCLQEQLRDCALLKVSMKQTL